MEKKLPPPEKSDFIGKQLSLFQSFSCTEKSKDDKSNLVEFWDSIPKYYVSKQEQTKIRKDGFLPTLTKNFIHKSISYAVKIRPALLTVDGQDMAFYPSAKEELVEDALRKLAVKQGSGYLNDKRHGVTFSMYELRKELEKVGHTYSHAQLVESIEILQGVSVEVRTEDETSGSFMFKTSILTSVISVSKKSYLSDPKAKWFIDFSFPIATEINSLAYRQYNYQKSITSKSQLTRYLVKRLSINYIQAAPYNNYTISLNSISRDSGLLKSSVVRENKRNLENSLDELIYMDVIKSYESDVIKGNRGKIEDVKYKLIPAINFVKEMIEANTRAKQLQAES